MKASLRARAGSAAGAVAPANRLIEAADRALAPMIVLFGSPGSGKGTQAQLLHERFGWGHVSTGDMLRCHIARADKIGLAVEGLLRTGRLVSDELVNDMVEHRLAEPDSQSGVILDGYPRTVGQAEVLLGLIANHRFRAAVVHLLVDHGRIVARLSGRRQCPLCGTLYSNKTHPPKVPGICDLDGKTLVTREDDREEVIRQRLNEYERQTRPVLDFFRHSGVPMIETQGASKMPEEIMRSMCGALSEAGLIAASSVPNVNVAS